MKLFSRGKRIDRKEIYTKEWLGEILQEEDKEVWVRN